MMNIQVDIMDNSTKSTEPWIEITVFDPDHKTSLSLTQDKARKLKKDIAARLATIEKYGD